MDLQSIKTRINRLLEQQGNENESPSTIVVLPDCGHGPDSDTRPFPRVNRVGKVAVIVYDPAVGQPSAEAIRQLVDEVTS